MIVVAGNAKIASCHEFDSHVFPNSAGVDVSIADDDRARRACVVHGSSLSWCSRVNVYAHKERHNRSKNCNTERHFEVLNEKTQRR